jgi:hypothetical protein
MPSGTCVILSEACGGEALKKSSVSERHKLFKEGSIPKQQMKTILKIFFDIKGIFHFEFIPEGQTVSQAYYVEMMKPLRETVYRKMPEFWSNDFILHDDNAPPHQVLCVKLLLAQKSITETEQPFFPSDLAPNDFRLFPETKSALKGRRFQDIEDIQKM